MNITEEKFKEILDHYRKYTVYGLSPNQEKTSYQITEYMRSFGYDIKGTHPTTQILKEIPLEYRKMVNVFIRSENLMPVVDEILSLGGTEVIWFQLGITNPEVEKKAEDAGIKVISDRCIYVEYKKNFNA